ncbi:MAG: hypothetical protein U1E77_04500 [Inhella sp.]
MIQTQKRAAGVQIKGLTTAMGAAMGEGLKLAASFAFPKNALRALIALAIVSQATHSQANTICKRLQVAQNSGARHAYGSLALEEASDDKTDIRVFRGIDLDGDGATDLVEGFCPSSTTEPGDACRLAITLSGGGYIEHHFLEDERFFLIRWESEYYSISTKIKSRKVAINHLSRNGVHQICKAKGEKQ